MSVISLDIVFALGKMSTESDHAYAEDGSRRAARPDGSRSPKHSARPNPRSTSLPLSGISDGRADGAGGSALSDDLQRAHPCPRPYDEVADGQCDQEVKNSDGSEYAHLDALDAVERRRHDLE